MASALAEIRDRFTAAMLLGELDAAFAAAGLPAPLHLAARRELAQAARYPALAFELGPLEARSEGAGGLRALLGEGIWWLAMGGADEALLTTRLATMTDLVRATVESALAGEFQQLRFRGATPGGELLRQAGTQVRVVPVRFAYQWLYQAGVL